MRLHNIKDWIDHSFDKTNLVDINNYNFDKYQDNGNDYNDDDSSDVIKFNLSEFIREFFDTSNGKHGASCQYQIYASPITLNGIIEFL